MCPSCWNCRRIPKNELFSPDVLFLPTLYPTNRLPPPVVFVKACVESKEYVLVPSRVTRAREGPEERVRIAPYVRLTGAETEKRIARARCVRLTSLVSEERVRIGPYIRLTGAATEESIAAAISVSIACLVAKE